MPDVTRPSVKTVLLKAADVLETKGWAQGRYAYDSAGRSADVDGPEAGHRPPVADARPGGHEGAVHVEVVGQVHRLRPARRLRDVGLHRRGELKGEGFVLTCEDELEVVIRLRRLCGLGSRVNGLAEDVNEAQRLIKLGVGIGFLQVLAAAEAVAKGRLWPLLHAELEPSYDIFLLARSEPSRDTATQLFLDEVIRRVRAQRRP